MDHTTEDPSYLSTHQLSPLPILDNSIIVLLRHVTRLSLLNTRNMAKTSTIPQRMGISGIMQVSFYNIDDRDSIVSSPRRISRKYLEPVVPRLYLPVGSDKQYLFLLTRKRLLTALIVEMSSVIRAVVMAQHNVGSYCRYFSYVENSDPKKDESNVVSAIPTYPSRANRKTSAGEIPRKFEESEA